MRIAVTGGLGFIGQKIVEELIAGNHEVTIVDFWSNLITEYEEKRYPILSSVYRTVTQAARLIEPWEFLETLAGSGAEVIVHAGARVDTRDLGQDGLWRQNVGYTRDLCKEVGRVGSHMVFISSAAVYGSQAYPNNPYGLSKVLGEKAVSEMKTRSVSLRLFNVFGENEHHKGEMASVPFKIAQAYKSGDTFRMFAPHAKRDFVPVSTVAKTVVAEATDLLGPAEGWSRRHRILDVGTGVATTFEDLDAMVMRAMGERVSRTKIVDMPPEYVGRYQGFTCAGMAGTANARTSAIATQEGVNDYYSR